MWVQCLDVHINDLDFTFNFNIFFLYNCKEKLLKLQFQLKYKLDKPYNVVQWWDRTPGDSRPVGLPNIEKRGRTVDVVSFSTVTPVIQSRANTMSSKSE